MKIALKAIFVGLILFCLSFQTVVAVTYDFTGTFMDYKGSNIIYVNITESKIPELIGERDVLLPQPLAEYLLKYLFDQKLSFKYLGHDLSGKLIGEAYYNGLSLQESGYGGSFSSGGLD